MKRKIVISLFALFSLFAAGAAIAALYITKSTGELSRLVQLHQIENLRRALVISIQTVQSDLYTVKTPLGRKLNSIVVNVTNLETSARGCSSCHHSAEMTERLEEIQSLIQDYQTALSYYITASANVERIGRLELEAAAIGNRLLRYTEEMSFTASERLSTITGNAMAEINNVKTILYVTLAFAFLLGLLVSVNLIKSITRPVHELLSATGIIASGYLGHRIVFTDRTEFGELASNFNRMSAALQEGYEKLETANRDLQREISVRSAAEEKIEKAYRMTRDILEKSPFGIYLVDSGGTIEYANHAMLEISGETFTEFVGANVFKLEGHIRAGLSEKIGSVLDGDSFLIEGIEFTSYHSRKTTVRNYIGIPFEEDKRKALIFVEDITERIRLEGQLRHSQKMEAVGTLTGGIAHEFNNIMATIMGNCELCLEEMEADDPMRNYLNMILVSSERGASLTQNLLTYSRKQIIRKEPLGLNRIIRKVEGILSSLIGEDIELRLNLAEDELAVMGDSNQLEQVLVNLVTNARDAMPAGGTLSISTGLEEMDEAFVKEQGYGEPGLYALITVTDTGVGMDEDTRKKIFEPFFTTKDIGKGTGLGLSMIYGIVERHSGFVTVASEPGGGSTFKVHLPAVDMPLEKAPPEGRRVESLDGDRETILVAEDDAGLRITLTNSLRKAGYKVIEAVNGDDALKKFEKNRDRVDLILSDVVMPKKNGKEVYDEVKKSRPDIKVIFISGYSDLILHEKGILREKLNYIPKPVSREDLLRKVKEVLSEDRVKNPSDA